MRIIAGKAKGHRLIPPKGSVTRPTSDRVKESIFNIIQNYIDESIVVDLFSGTGNLGIEALSRNASKAYFIDYDKMSTKVIKENLEKTRLLDYAVILPTDAIMAIKKLANEHVKADIIFMDPPYQKGYIFSTLEEIARNELLHPHGIIVVEHDKSVEVPTNVHNLFKSRTNTYGNTSVSFYRMREDL